MKLKRVRRLTPATLKGRVPGDLHETLAAYAGYYREVHGEAIDLWPLLVQMLRAFMDADREFLAWRRNAGRDADGASARSGNGTGRKSGSG